MKKGILIFDFIINLRLGVLNCRRNILERMTYNSSSGSISNWVEKLQNIEGAIKSTQENLKRRANGLPPLPPPGLSHMQPAKPTENSSNGVTTTNGIKPKGVTAVSKPIIGLGRGKRFSKQNSLPTGVGEATTVTSASAVPAIETVSSSLNGRSEGVLAHSRPNNPQLLSNCEVIAQHQCKKQQLSVNSEVFSPSLSSSGNEILNEDQFKEQQQLSSRSEMFQQLSLKLIISDGNKTCSCYPCIKIRQFFKC